MSIEIKAKDVQMVEVGNIIDNPKNPNRHSIEQIERLAKMIKFAGFRDPLIVSNRTGFLLCGHGRKQAAESLGMTHLPVSYQDFSNEAEEYTFMTGHNEIARWSELDMQSLYSELDSLTLAGIDLDLLGIEGFTLPSVDKLDPQCDEDEVPESAPTRCQPGDVWTLGRHRLMCGDSTSIDAVEKLMAGEKADIVWTDPPYNVAYEGKTKDALKIANDEMDDEKFYQFLCDTYSNMLLHTKPGGAIYVAHADSEGANFRQAMKDAGWLLKQTLIWVKQTLVMGRQDYHWKHEPILYGWAPGAAHSWYTDRKQTTVLEFNRPSRSGEHPTMKPVELVEYCLGNSSSDNSTVLDLFGGSGTTMIASEKLNRMARLMELEPKYCDVILARWEKYTGKVAVLEAQNNVVQ